MSTFLHRNLVLSIYLSLFYRDFINTVSYRFLRAVHTCCMIKVNFAVQERKIHRIFGLRLLHSSTVKLGKQALS